MDFKWLKTTFSVETLGVFSFKITTSVSRALIRLYSQMKNICYPLVSILVISIILLLVFFNNFIIVKNSNTSIRPNIMRTLFIETGKINVSDKEETLKSGNKTKKVKCHVPKFMLEIYENNKTGFNSSGPDVVRSVIPKQANSYNGEHLVENFSDSHLLIFDLPRTNDDEIFINAELKILTLIEDSETTFRGVEKILSLSVYDELRQQFVNVHILHIYHTNDTWLSFDLTNQVAQILDSEISSKYLKVAIKMTSLMSMRFKELSKLKLSLLPLTEDIFEHDYPILLLSYILASTVRQKEIVKKEKEEIKIRKRRFLDEDYEEESNNIWDDMVSKRTYGRKLKRIRNTCNRKPLYINFADINYDEWIVQPSGYEAFQCQGKCFYPVAEHLSPTKHAIVQALLHSVAPSQASRSCCVPTSLDSISILYVDDRGVLTYRYAYRDMVVLECGCR